MLRLKKYTKTILNSIIGEASSFFLLFSASITCPIIEGISSVKTTHFLLLLSVLYQKYKKRRWNIKMKKLTMLTKITNAVTNATGRTGLKVKGMAPELLIVGGVIGIVGSTFLACKATLKLDEIVDTTKETVDKINETKESKAGMVNEADVEIYSEKDANKDLYITYVQTGTKIAKLYLPSVTLGVLSIGAILYSFKILKGRNLALMAAYKGLEGAFGNYRARVIADVGVDKDREYKYGIRKEEVTTAENGKEKDTTTTIDVIDSLDGSPYAIMFDENCSNWVKNPDYNRTYLSCQQQHANDILNARGHIFLNEIYDMLGTEHTDAGAITGWVKGGSGDQFVDFNLFDGAFTKDADGYSKGILLDFNVDGIMYNKIDKKKKVK
jgi:hypothetical protein